MDMKENRKDNRRALILSRWPGHGGHRYPFGFSGDAVCEALQSTLTEQVVEWRALQILPEITSKACSNALFLWSHDVGVSFTALQA